MVEGGERSLGLVDEVSCEIKGGSSSELQATAAREEPIQKYS